MPNKTILIDFHNLAFRNFFSIKSEFGGFQSDAWCYFMIKSLLKIIDRLSPFQTMFLCVDSKLSWRKVLYPKYKANRIKKDEDKEDFEKFFAEMCEFTRFVEKNLPVGVIEVNFAEGDDIIGAICHEIENCVIVSPDKDFVQCLQYGDDIKIYNPMKDEYVICEDPKRNLQIHCYIGDKSDNIPNCKKGVGPKTAEKIIDGKVDKTEEIIFGERFNRFLVDLEYMPKKIYDNVIAEYDKLYNSQSSFIFHEKQFCGFCEKNNIQEFWKNIDDICGVFTDMEALLGHE